MYPLLPWFQCVCTLLCSEKYAKKCTKTHYKFAQKMLAMEHLINENYPCKNLGIKRGRVFSRRGHIIGGGGGGGGGGDMVLTIGTESSAIASNSVQWYSHIVSHTG